MNTPNDYKVPDWNNKTGDDEWKAHVPTEMRAEWTSFSDEQQQMIAEWAEALNETQAPIPADPPIATVAALARMGKLRIRTVPGWLYRTSLELPRPAPTDTWFYNDGDCCWERSHWGGKERDTARNNGRVYRYPADPDFETAPPEAEGSEKNGPVVSEGAAEEMRRHNILPMYGWAHCMGRELSASLNRVQFWSTLTGRWCHTGDGGPHDLCRYPIAETEAGEEKQGGEYMVLDGNCENIPLTDDERQAATYPTIEAAEAAVIAEIEPDPGAFEGWGDDDSFSDSFAIVRIVRRVLPVLTVSLAVRLEEQA